MKSNSSWDVNTVTWNNQPGGNSSSQIILSASTSNKQAYIVDVTNFVKDEINTPATAYGFVMQLAIESYYRSVLFGASDHVDSSIRPKLEIEYSK